MIIDSNLIFSDGAVAKSGDSAVVALNAFHNPSRQDSIPVFMQVTGGDITGVSALEIKLQQSDSEKGEWTDVPAAQLNLTSAAQMKKGCRFGWRFLPDATKPWLRLHYTVSGSAGGEGRLFAAIVGEDELPYEKGMYIDGGVVRG